MSDELTNLDNPMNRRNDLEERNQPHVTAIPAQADDIFDDSMTSPPTPRRGSKKCETPEAAPQETDESPDA